MKILVLEDNLQRIIKFKRGLIGHNVDYSETALLAKKLVMHNKYDLIFLDHDLGGEYCVNSDNRNTGYQVAKQIKDSQNKDTDVIIHSCNYVGAFNIKEVLKHGNLIPFIILDIAKAVQIVQKSI